MRSQIFRFVMFCFFVLSLFFINSIESGFTFSLFAREKECDVFYFSKKPQDDSNYVGLFYLNKQESDCDVGGLVILSRDVSVLEVAEFFNAKLVSFEKVEDLKIFYLYTALLPKNIDLNGKKFNLQVIFDKNNVKIAYPINFAGF